MTLFVRTLQSASHDTNHISVRQSSTNFPKNLLETSKFSASKGWHERSSTPRTHKHQGLSKGKDKVHLRMRHEDPGGSRCIALLFFNLDSRLGGWSTPRSGRFSPRKLTWYPLYRRMGGPQGRSGRMRKISPLPGFDPQTDQPVASCYTGGAIPALNIKGYRTEFSRHGDLASEYCSPIQ